MSEVNWREEAVNLKDLERFWMKEWSLISCQVFSNLISVSLVSPCPVFPSLLCPYMFFFCFPFPLGSSIMIPPSCVWFLPLLFLFSLISFPVFLSLGFSPCLMSGIVCLYPAPCTPVMFIKVILMVVLVSSSTIRHYRRKCRAVKLANGGFKKYWIKGCR